MSLLRPRRALGLVLALQIVLGLQGCANVDVGMLGSSLRLHAQKSAEERKEAIKAFADSKSWFSEGTWNGAFGEYLVYLPDNFKELYTRDEDTFLSYVLGAALARNPKWTYDEFRSYAGDFISRERFDYIRNFGGIFLKSLESDPRNAAVKQRLALFKKRFGQEQNAYQSFVVGSHLRDLLRDDAKLTQFLTDDTFAQDWIAGHTDRNATDRDRVFFYGRGPTIMDLLKPVTTGVLPALAS